MDIATLNIRPTPPTAHAGNPGIVPPWLVHPGAAQPSIWGGSDVFPLPGVSGSARMQPLPVTDPRNLDRVMPWPDTPMPDAGDTFVPLPQG